MSEEARKGPVASVVVNKSGAVFIVQDLVLRGERFEATPMEGGNFKITFPRHLESVMRRVSQMELYRANIHKGET